MTITVSVEELRAHEQACVKWSAKRAEFYGKQLVVHTSHMSLHVSIDEKAGTAERLQQWERENPFPKLLPAV